MEIQKVLRCTLKNNGDGWYIDAVDYFDSVEISEPDKKTFQGEILQGKSVVINEENKINFIKFIGKDRVFVLKNKTEIFANICSSDETYVEIRHMDGTTGRIRVASIDYLRVPRESDYEKMNLNR
jgi:hypothetical protein